MWHQYLQVTRCDLIFWGYIYTRFSIIIVNPILFDKDLIRLELYSFNVRFVYTGSQWVNNQTIQIYIMIIENGNVGVTDYILSQHTSGDLKSMQCWDHTIIVLCYIYSRVMDISIDSYKVKLVVFISPEVNK
jgi:hypothetical protein